MEGRLTLMMSLQTMADGGLNVTVLPIRDGEKLTADRTALVLSVWEESRGIIRGSLRHRNSGAVAYFQGNQALLDLAREMNLDIVRSSG